MSTYQVVNPEVNQYITVASNDPTNITGSNANFINYFSQDIVVNGVWVVALQQATFSPAAINTPYYVYADCVFPQQVGSFTVQLLANLPGSPVLTPVEISYQDPLQNRQVNRSAFNSITITIRDGLGNIPVFATPTILTLQFTKLR